jgi:hypothetical protein
VPALPIPIPVHLKEYVRFLLINHDFNIKNRSFYGSFLLWVNLALIPIKNCNFIIFTKS